MASEELNTGALACKPFSSGPLGRIATLRIVNHDIPSTDVATFGWKGPLQVDTETDGLDFRRDKLRLATIANNEGNIILVRNPDYRSKNLKQVLESTDLLFHHLAFDLKFLYWWCGIKPYFESVQCTKILSKMVRPKASSSLYKVIPEVLGVEAFKDKEITLSNWNVKKLSASQIVYACTDVYHLTDLWSEMSNLLGKQHRRNAYKQACTAASIAAYVEAEGFADTLSYEGQPNEKLRSLWEKRRKVIR